MNQLLIAAGIVLALSSCQNARTVRDPAPGAGVALSGTDAGNPLVSLVERVGNRFSDRMLTCLGETAQTLSTPTFHVSEVIEQSYIDSTLGSQFGFYDLNATSREMIAAELSAEVTGSPESAETCIAMMYKPTGPGHCKSTATQAFLIDLHKLLRAIRYSTTIEYREHPEYENLTARVRNYFIEVNAYSARPQAQGVCAQIFSYGYAGASSSGSPGRTSSGPTLGGAL